MGIDFAIGTAQDAIMLDQRSQAFCSSNNRWFSNQLPADQHYLTMNRVEALDGPMSPPGLAHAGLSPGFVSHGGNRHLNMSSSTDAFDDLTGPTMDNGYGICQSPGLESIYSNQTNIGTPNSFITDCQVDSPRERLFSTSSSTYTYSPYNAHEERTCTPTIQRQASLDMVEQFFNNSPGVTACTDENGLLDSSSQGFATHCISNADFAEPQNIFLFDGFLTNPIDVLSIPGITNFEGSPQTDSTQTSNSGEDNTTTTPCNSDPATVYVNSNTNADNIPVMQENSYANPLPRTISTLSELINETIAPNTQDALMVNDCVKSFEASTAFSTINVQILDMNSHSPKAQETNTPVQQSADTTSTEMPSEDVFTVRRERNNAACRASRKRRKDKKTEMEHSVGRLEEENRDLVVKIDHLERECKRFKAEIVARMAR